MVCKRKALSFLEDVLLPFIQGPHTRYIPNIHLVLFCCSSEVLSSISRYLYLNTSTALTYLEQRVISKSLYFLWVSQVVDFIKTLKRNTIIQKQNDKIFVQTSLSIYSKSTNNQCNFLRNMSVMMNYTFRLINISTKLNPFQNIMFKNGQFLI